MNYRLLILISVLIVCLRSNSYSQFEEFASKYGILSTIAGAGDIDNSGYNGWLELYEGREANEAELSRPHFAMADSLGNIYLNECVKPLHFREGI